MRLSSFFVIFLAAAFLICTGCKNSEQKTDTENAASTSEQASEDIGQKAEEAVEETEEGVKDIAEDVVKKSEEMHEVQVEELDKKAPPEIAAELWKLIHTEGYQEHWKEWTPEEGAKPNTKTYVNDIAYNALEKKEKQLPPGSIIVEDNYDDQEQLKTVKTVINLGGDNPLGGWFWAEYSPDGTPINMERGSASLKGQEEQSGQ